MEPSRADHCSNSIAQIIRSLTPVSLASQLSTTFPNYTVWMLVSRTFPMVSTHIPIICPGPIASRGSIKARRQVPAAISPHPIRLDLIALDFLILVGKQPQTLSQQVAQRHLLITPMIHVPISYRPIQT